MLNRMLVKCARNVRIPILSNQYTGMLSHDQYVAPDAFELAGCFYVPASVLIMLYDRKNVMYIHVGLHENHQVYLSRSMRLGLQYSI